VLRDDVDMPAGAKDTHFFHNFHEKGIEWYADHFRYATGERTIVEICPGAFFRPGSPERIKTHIPNCKIFATMRDPVDRIYSVYKLQRHYGVIRKTLDEMVKVFPNLGFGNRYAFHLKGWFESFGRENVLVTIFDELRAEPQKYLNRVTDFMDLERIALSQRRDLSDDANSFARAPKSRRLARRATTVLTWLNGHQAYAAVDALDRAGVWKFCHGRGEPFPQLTPEQEARLRERYLPEVEALEDLLRIDLSAWKKPRTPRNIEDAPRALLSANR
jgi:Sulfotransferase domain